MKCPREMGTATAAAERAASLVEETSCLGSLLCRSLYDLGASTGCLACVHRTCNKCRQLPTYLLP